MQGDIEGANVEPNDRKVRYFNPRISKHLQPINRMRSNGLKPR